MIENPISSTSLYNQCSTLNYTQAAMMGLTGSSLQDSQQLGYSNHGNIPNIILTGREPDDALHSAVAVFMLLAFPNRPKSQNHKVSFLVVGEVNVEYGNTPKEQLRCRCAVSLLMS